MATDEVPAVAAGRETLAEIPPELATAVVAVVPTVADVVDPAEELAGELGATT